jgi:hypothetical protein
MVRTGISLNPTEAMQKLLKLLFEIHGFHNVRLGHRPVNVVRCDNALK